MRHLAVGVAVFSRVRVFTMSDPREEYEANPHPASSHRTPTEIAEDEAGPIGHDGHRRAESIQGNNGPVEKIAEKKGKSASSDAENKDST